MPCLGWGVSLFIPCDSFMNPLSQFLFWNHILVKQTGHLDKNAPKQDANKTTASGYENSRKVTSRTRHRNKEAKPYRQMT